MRESFFRVLAFFGKPVVGIGSALILGGAIVALAYWSTSTHPISQTVAVKRGAITQEVDVSATVKAAHSTDLSFQTSGRIAAVDVSVGDHVSAGQTLVTLDGASQSAGVAQAKANLQVAEAKLDALEAGTRPEQLSIDETSLAQAAQALNDAVQSAYVSADDAVHAKADQVFTNPRTTSARLTYTASDAALTTKVENERIALEPVFTSWQNAISASSSDPTVAASVSSDDLAKVGAFLDDLAAILVETPPSGSLTSTALTGYETLVNTARGNISVAETSLTTQLTAYKGVLGALALAKAGATPQDIAAASAGVAAAQAALSTAEIALGDTVLTAPVSGTITVQNADIGASVAPGAPLVSMIADGKYQAVARVSDADIAKIQVGDSAEAISDSYSGTTFSGTVTTVDPAATTDAYGNEGYDVTVTFAENDPRLISGTNVMLSIITATKDGVLMVPSSAVLQNTSGTFVYIAGPDGKPVATPVTTGIESADGMIEVTSGLSEGENVLAYGSATAPIQ